MAIIFRLQVHSGEKGGGGKAIAAWELLLLSTTKKKKRKQRITTLPYTAAATTVCALRAEERFAGAFHSGQQGCQEWQGCQGSKQYTACAIASTGVALCCGFLLFSAHIYGCFKNI